MPDEPAVAAQDLHSAAKSRRRSRRWLIAGAVVVAVATAGFVVSRNDRSSSAADTGEAPRFVDDTGLSGVDHSYEGEY